MKTKEETWLQTLVRAAARMTLLYFSTFKSNPNVMFCRTDALKTHACCDM